MTTAEAFVEELDRAVTAKLEQIRVAATAAEPGPEIGVRELLVVALEEGAEASEEAAIWMVSEPDVDVKLSLARQCGDEAKHYRLIEQRLRELGVDPAKLDPTAGGPTPMYAFLKGLATTVERVAAGQFTREALAGVHNQVFIDHCEAQGDLETARLYREIIQPDEGHHHQMGRTLLLRLATTDADQARARAAAEKTLEIAEELQDLVRLKRGICRAPGC